MKYILTVVLFFSFTLSVFSQVSLSKKENALLMDLFAFYEGEKETPLVEKAFKKPPAQFKDFIQQLKMLKNHPEGVLDPDILTKPDRQTLVFWYVMRELHYNKQESDSFRLPEQQLLSTCLADTTDERWLLDNFYYRISPALKIIFNEADMSDHNFQLDELNLITKTEKAVFVFFIVNSCGQRVSIMNITGNEEGALKTLDRMPKIEGKAYFEYIDFDFPDFEWKGFKETESYKTRHIGNFYDVLLSHLSVLIDNNKREEVKKLFESSILSRPEYFVFSSSHKLLQGIYDSTPKEE